MIKCIIIDDELKSRENLKILINDFCKDVSVQELCSTVDEALKAIKTHKPDLIFLDIQLKGETGFDLLAKFEDINFEIIFTTAYSEYAVKAFQFSAIDYLLKPIDLIDLKRALNKINKKLLQHSTATRIEQLIHNIQGAAGEQKLALPISEGFVFVKIKDITYCEASSNYTEISLIDGSKYLVSRTLKEYEELLMDYGFFRIHHSYLVNLSFIKKYVRGEGGYVIMHDDTPLDVSKRKKESFLSRIGTRLT